MLNTLLHKHCYLKCKVVCCKFESSVLVVARKLANCSTCMSLLSGVYFCSEIPRGSSNKPIFCISDSRTVHLFFSEILKETLNYCFSAIDSSTLDHFDPGLRMFEDDFHMNLANGPTLLDSIAFWSDAHEYGLMRGKQPNPSFPVI